MKVEACGDEIRGTSGKQKIQAWFGMRFAGLLFDNICRLPSGLGLQVFCLYVLQLSALHTISSFVFGKQLQV